MPIQIPPSYRPTLDLMQTQVAIKEVKDFFQSTLSDILALRRVTAPLLVSTGSGLNDNLNGVERPVRFDVRETGEEFEIVHSLAKWKRYALGRYGFGPGQGLYTDMNAIRRDEDTDNLHSIYVDQWDWEKVITPEERTRETLHATVEDIYRVMRSTETYVAAKYPALRPVLPPDITFLTSQELEDAYPDLTPKQREEAACRKYGAVFIEGIGGKLRSGQPHDGRAPDYDDWQLNGDIMVDYPLLGSCIELSSMGVRVDADTLRAQLEERGCLDRAELPFQKALLSGELPQTIGGGIGQSRLCMFFLRKAHIGEVQSSVWPKETEEICRQAGIPLL